VGTALVALGLMFGVPAVRTRLLGAPVFDVMDAQEVGAMTGARAPATAGGDSIDGPFGAASRMRLGICVDDTTGTLAAGDLTTRVGGALAELGSTHVQFASDQLGPRPLIALACPSASPLLREDFASPVPALPTVRRHLWTAGSTVTQATPFRVYVFIAPSERIKHLFPNTPPSSRTHPHEMLSGKTVLRPGIVSIGLYLAPSEVLDPTALRRGLGAALGIGFPIA